MIEDPSTTGAHAGASGPAASGHDLRPVEEIRAAFPALERTVDGRQVAYFDGPGGTQVPTPVVDGVSEYLLRHNANSGWAYPSSRETDAVVAEARRAFADFFDCAPTEVVFGANMTTLTLHVSRALARRLGAGDEVVVTELDHHANVDPWREAARDAGASVRTVRMRPGPGDLDWDDFERKVGPATRIVAVGAASNAVGTISDVGRAAELARAVDALLFVDAVHLAPHAPLDVGGMGADLLACSAYKFYGPHLGVLYGREDLLASLDVPKVAPAPDTAPERIETGTPDFEGIAGAAAAVDFLASLAPGAAGRRRRLEAALRGLHDRGASLLERMWDGLASTTGVTVYGPPPGRDRTPTVSFAVDGAAPADVADGLAARGVFVSHGDFYASTLLERLGHGRDGLLRAGCACYTSADEVDRLLEGVAAIARSSGSR